MKYDAYQTSSAQKRLFFITKLYEGSILYNINSAWIIEGKLNVTQLEKALKKLVERHETLRTSFAVKDGKVYQKVFHTIDVELKYRSSPVKSDDNAIIRLVDEFVQPFDLEEVPLWRAELVRLEPEKYILLFDIHHIISDGMSMNVLIGDLAVFYSGAELPPLEFQYVDFTLWQNKMFSSEQMKKQEEYWLKVFEEEPPLLSLPYDYSRPLETDVAGNSVDFEINRQWTGTVNRLAVKNKTTLYMVLLAVYNILLSRYTAQEDIIVGSPISGRAHKEFEAIIGMFVNTLAMRSRPLSRMTFQEFLESVSNHVFAAFNNQDYPFEMLVEKLMPQRHPNRNPLIDTMFALQNLPKSIEMIGGSGCDIEGTLRVIPYSHREKVAKFDLTLFAYETDRRLLFRLEYRTSLFREGAIKRMIGHFKNIVYCVCENPQVRIADIEILNSEERQLLIFDFNRTAVDYPADKTLHQLFEEQAEKTPDSDAVVGYGNIFITFGELNEKSDQVACLLKEKGVLADNITGIMMERSVEMIIGILGILKAGGAYLPIDPEYPQERIDYMLKDSGAKLSVTADNIFPSVFSASSAVKNLLPATGHRQPATSLAYIIYTSGTTGRPKGCLITHKNVVSLLKNKIQPFDFNEQDVWTMFHQYNFDFSVWEMYGALLYGGKLIVIPRMVTRDPGQYLEILKQEKVTILNQTPSAFYHLSDAEVCQPDYRLYLRYVIFGGEALNPVRLKQWRAKYPGTKLINMFGITETTIHVTHKEIGDKEIEIGTSNIGRPLATLTAYVLDQNLKPVPIGVPGELCVGGEGLARGYLNRPGLTAEKFNRDLKKNEKNYKQTHKQKFLQKSPPGLLYKSGDLVKFSENGDLEYLGRIDQQVKIRGFRIEPAEIETQLLKHGGIKQAVVIAGEDENKDKYLCAYIVPDRELSIVELREYLSKDLAGYMIPSHFVFLDEIPLTTNGKVDRRRLPAPGYGYGQTPDVCVPPGDYIESRLAAIWSEVLNIPVESIGIAGNFFALGGHSLKAAVMVSRIHKALDVKVPLAVVFKSPTIKGLSGYIRQEASTDAFISIEPGEEKEYYPLSRGQERFYFLQQMAPESTAYNLMHIFHPREKILKKELEHALTRLIARHESLGTSFQVVEETGELVQMIHSPETIDFKLEYYQTNDEKEQELEEVRDIVRNFGRPFDLARAPLLRAGLICSANSRDIVMVDIHHIISDGTSLQVLVRDFMSLYDGENEELAPMKLQYKDFSQWQHDLIRSGKMKIHEDYWLRQLVGPLPEIRLPTDYPKPEERGFAGYSFRRVLEGQLVRDLRALVQHTGTTLYMVLLTAYNILLFKYTGLTDIIIGSPAARRDHADLESIIGLVMESIMMRNFPRPEKTFREFLQEVKERTLKAYEHQVYPYEELIKKLDYTKDSPWAEVTNVSLIVQNMVEIAARDTTPPADAPSYVPDTARLDLTLAVWESRETILLDFEYSTRLFKKETIERLAGHFLKILEEAIKNPDIFLSYIDIIDDGEKTRTIGSSPPFYPLSHPQKRIYYTEKVYTGTTCNTLAFTVRYNEIPDKQVLEQAINRVIQKNDALRLRIVTFDFLDEPLQYISPFKHYIIDVLDFSDTPGRSEDRLRQWIESDVRKPMPFINSNLFYFAYIRFNEKESGFYMKVHHFINDGWTVFLLIHEINDIYEALEEGRTMDETSNPSYIDYLSDELAYLKSPRAGVDREFWHRCLLPLPEKAPLSGNRKENRTNAAVTGIEGAACILPFPVDLRSKILRYSSANKTSIFKLLLSALSIFISRVNGCDDTVIGSAGHNRTNDIYRKMAGMFVSTVPLRIRIENRMDFREFVEKVGEDTNYILKNHQRYPFDRLSEELREETGIDPVYLLNINLVSHPDVPEDKFRMEHHFPGYEPTPLSIHINGNNRNIHGILELEWNYQTLHCSPEEIIRMHRCLINILDDALSYPGKKLSEIELISEEEKQQVLYRFNDTMGEGESCYSGAKTVYRLFEEQAGWSPDHVAVTGRGHISFRELDRKSGQLALVLREKGVLADDIIGIMVNRSIEMIIGIWGILKAGGAYLPIDSDYPRERIDYMLKDSGSKLLVTPDNLEALDFPSLPATGHRPPATSLAYVIYTSGSTGKPKAVGVEHGNLLGYIDAFANEFDLRADDVVIQQASFSFDAFVEEFYPILLQGGKLAVPRREEVLDMDLLSRFIRGHHVTMITCSPLMLKELSNLEYIDRLRTVRIFISGGDRLKKEYIDKLLNMGAVYNTYGPTEATVCATYYRCGADSSNGVPIGKPIRNYRVYVLDRHGNLLPVGLTGELCISGVGVARGYLNRPELTKQKFFRGSRGPAARGGAAGAFAPSRESLNCDSQLPSVPVTFIIHHSSSIIQLRPPGLLYKTGDLARWLPDANIEFMGRLDEQANIRGYRIEPGEIEYRLSQHPQVRESLVTVIEDGKGDQSLCAYIVGAEPKTSQLKDYLSQTLPDYMIPTYILAIDRIPLTPNGKVDKKSLPAPGEGQVRSARITPRNKTEEKLLRIFSDILHLEKESISIDDSFFDIGGHSLKAALLASTIHKELNVKISLAEIFNRPTIMALTRYIEKAQKERLRPIKRAERKLFYPLSSAQKRLYVLQQLEPRSTSYNMPTVVALEGDLNIGWMDMAFRELVQRHESFRTSFPMINSKPVQRIHPEVHFVVEYYDITVEWGANVEMIIRNFIRPFDLSRPPLLRVGIIKTDENKHVLMVDMHHIVSDGLSMSIFIQEFVRLYNGEELPPLQIQYKDFADWQVQQWEKGVFKKQEEYWLNRFAGEIPKLRLPFDYPTFAVSGFEGSHFIFEVEKNLLIKTREVLSRTGATLQQFLLAVYYILLSRYTRLEDIVVGCPVTGRSHADLQHVIGMFVNMLPIRSQPRGDKTFREFLEEVKENTFNAYENQDYPFEELVARLRLQGETGGNPLFDAAFALNTREGSKDEGKKGSLKVTPVEFERKVSIFAVTLRAYEAPVNLSLELEYKTARFKPSTMEKYAKRYIEILEQAVENIDLQLKDVSVSHELVALKTDVFAEDESDFRF